VSKRRKPWRKLPTIAEIVRRTNRALYSGRPVVTPQAVLEVLNDCGPESHPVIAAIIRESDGHESPLAKRKTALSRRKP